MIKTPTLDIDAPAPPRRDDETARDLLLCAVEALGGGALVLDEGLRVAGATQAAERLLGTRVPLGAHAVKLLCGEDVERPLAEALAAGRPAAGTIERMHRDATPRLVSVRARPLRAMGSSIGWLLLLSEEAARPEDVPELFHTMWTRDATVKRLFRLAEKVAHADASVLLQGEMGTGKDSLAAAIHASSERHAGPFRAVSCGSAPHDRIERHIAEHALAADGGTLFLDDIAELPHDAQAGLLRMLETDLWTPPDGSRPVPLDVRVIAATYASLQEEVLRGHFRADLMYRLRIVSLHLPPLRARRGDVALLAGKFIAELNARDLRQSPSSARRHIERIAPDALARLERHTWPGNVRELRAAIETAFVTGQGPVLLPADLPPDIGEAFTEAEVLVSPTPAPSLASAELSDETHRIRRALERASGDRAQAATMLGMSRTTLWRRMRALGLLPSSEDE